MSVAQPLLPGGDVTIRIVRDDGRTFAGVTIPPVFYTPDGGRARLAQAADLTPTEIARALASPARMSRTVREPILQGPGWLVILVPEGLAFFLQRDDGTHLSWQDSAEYFTIARAALAIFTIQTLTAGELARLSNAFGSPLAYVPLLAIRFSDNTPLQFSDGVYLEWTA